jgi:ATP-dependent Clp endopeptidase proteolytic subunit ClpP
MAKQFFNTMVPGEGKALLFIYGDFMNGYDGKVENIVSELMAVQQAYGQIEVHINSNGGDVFAGIAIINAFKSSPADIAIYIDGIAASMAAVIALCGRPLYMSKYSRIMLHSIKVGFYGNKEDLRVTIEEIETLENTLCSLVAGKMGKTPEEIRAAYFDGKDHWINASEALGLGLIDGIYDVEPVPDDSTNEQIYKIFNNRLDTRPQNVENMNIEEVKKRPSFVNAATDADVLRIVDALEVEAGKVPGLEERIAVFENAERARAEADIAALLDGAEADERIKKPQRAHFEAILKADPENGKAILAGLTPKKRVVNALEHPAATEASAWDKRMDDIRNKNKLN